MTDEPLTLREFSYDDSRQVVRFAFVGTKKGTAAAVTGFAPVTFGSDPSPEATERSIRAAIRSALEEAAATVSE